MWTNLQETADLVTFTEEILNEKLHFLCSVIFCNLFHFPLKQVKYTTAKYKEWVWCYGTQERVVTNLSLTIITASLFIALDVIIHHRVQFNSFLI